MIIVHDVFICKPGNASKLAKLFKEVMAGNTELINIMTDMTGQYNKVVMVSQFENLTGYEQSWEKYKEDAEAMKKMNEAMAGYHECISLVPVKFTRFGNLLSCLPWAIENQHSVTQYTEESEEKSQKHQG